jgi:predicted acylesterase/phospholipase RssA
MYRKQGLSIAMLLFILLLPTQVRSQVNQQPVTCRDGIPRALVLSGGGAKGAFQVGAVYHLIVERGCDFHDFSGVSVGALNVAFLAQAQTQGGSLANLKNRTNDLRDFWLGIRGSNDIFTPRFLGIPRLFLFGIENVYDFSPVRKKMHTVIDTALLRSSGRSVRVGTVDFFTGSYREVVASSVEPPEKFLDYIEGSAIIPVFGKMPRILEARQPQDPDLVDQFADGGVRHVTPIASYFPSFVFEPFRLVGPSAMAAPTRPNTSTRRTFADTPPHEAPIEELFVVLGSPYDPLRDVVQPAPQRVTTDGRKILARTLDLVLESPYRWDVNYAVLSNALLKWRSEALSRSDLPDPLRTWLSGNEFPVSSYNIRNGVAEPYRFAVVAPDIPNADTYTFDPNEIKCEIRRGCMAADKAMTQQLGYAVLTGACSSLPPCPLPQNLVKGK